MANERITIAGTTMDFHRYNTVVVGSGAAGLSAASRLYDLGQRDIALLTEGMNMGTSRNTGSDKQTYYRLSEAGDSVAEMARSLYAGGAADKDVAYCEAAGSLRAFYRLVELGVAFPQDRNGVFTGYKTDHDPKTRATSAGPSTSRFMTEALEREMRAREIDLYDGYEVVRICAQEQAVAGLIAIRRSDSGFAAFGCRNIVYATGGPAGIYARSVYPGSQTGATGAALEAGALAQNLTEWQYGLASVQFRWNVSGSYQQVIPRYLSIDPGGGDPREFLEDYFTDRGALYSAIFLKGYQWPFDPRKIRDGGSSLIDLLVYQETELRGRRVFMDFRNNPGGGALEASALTGEARDYLERLDLLFGTPLERLEKMNAPAIELYRAHGIDLAREPLEIQVAAQHCNGGLSGDIWWQSNLEGFFAVGEANGSHGVYRPGGSALNAGQVGSLRAAQYIAARRTGDAPAARNFEEKARQPVAELQRLSRRLTANTGGLRPREVRRTLGERMSRVGAFIRHPDDLHEALQQAREQLERFEESVACTREELPHALRCRDLLITQVAALTAMLDYIRQGGRSRGSYLVYDGGGQLPLEGLDERFRFSLDDGGRDGSIQQVRWTGSGAETFWRPVRELPQEEAAFEEIWRAFRDGETIQ